MLRSKNKIEINDSLLRLEKFIAGNELKGYDPYDGLTSPLFKIPFLKNHKQIRFLSQQLIKRSPLNLRPVLSIKKGYNPVTIGLCIQGYSKLIAVFPQNTKHYNEKIDFLISELENLIPEGFEGACWGYDFDWEARYSKIPAYQPTVVATGIISNALFKYWQISGNKKAEHLCISAADFILKNLNRTFDKDGDFCFSYSPFDHQVVFNASMKGVRLLAQAYTISKSENLKENARKACSFVIKHQQSNGSWIYSKNKAGEWVDNYHTGYILDCLQDYINLTNDRAFSKDLQKGYEFYKSNFFQDGRIPKFYSTKLYPIDCTAAGQSLLTLSNFNDLELAENVCHWMINNMQDKNGGFYFRKYKNYTNRTSFMRWSNAWMFAGMAEFLNKKSTKN